MKTKIIALLLFCIPFLSNGQTPVVQKFINGKICDTCYIRNDLTFSDFIPAMFVGTYTNPMRLSEKLDEFKNSIPKQQVESHFYLTTDSIFRLVFLTESEFNYPWPIQSGRKKIDFQQVEILVKKNQKQIKDWQILHQLPSVEGYKINRITWDEKKQREIVKSWEPTRQLDDFNLAYNDIISISFRDGNTKEIIKQMYIKRILDTPKHFVFFQTQTNGKEFKESLQSFLNDPVNSDFIRHKDTTNSFDLTRSNIGVFLFNALEDGEEIEYRLDKTLPWKSIRKNDKSAFEHKFIILDNEDVPPGETKTLYLRYKNQPETEIPVTIRGVEDLKQTSAFKIIAGFMLASLLFGVWYYFKQRNTKKRIQQLDQKNRTIETQLSLLSGQLNPHFLFNALNAIQGTIMTNNTEQANKYINDIASFLRRVMDEGKKEFISLQEELTLEEDYLKLEQKRKNFSYNIYNVSGLKLNDIDFPPLLLQPILENSIRHGLSTDITNQILEIQLLNEDKNLIINIRDNGFFWDVSKTNEKLGLSLTRKRIALYNEKMGNEDITMTTDYFEGTITTFTLKNWL